MRPISDLWLGAIRLTFARAIRHRPPRVLLACMPKSASSYLTNAIAALPGMAHRGVTYSTEHREQEIDLPRLARRSIGGFVSQQHVRYSSVTGRIMDEFGITPVVTTRNLFDVVASLRDHLRTISLRWPLARWSEAHAALPDDELDLAIVDMMMPWYLTFYLSWLEGAAESAKDDAETARDAAQTAGTNASASATAAAGSAVTAASAEAGAEAARDAAQDAETNAAGHESTVNDHRLAAAASEAAAAISETAAADSATAASNSAGDAAGHESNAEGFAEIAHLWAEEDEDVPVSTEPDKFSAKHWAAKAEEAASAVDGVGGPVSSTDGAFAVWDGTDGDRLKDGPVFGTTAGTVAAGDHSHDHFTATDNPHGVTAVQVGAYTTAATDALLDDKLDKAGGTVTGAIEAGCQYAHAATVAAQAPERAMKRPRGTVTTVTCARTIKIRVF